MTLLFYYTLLIMFFYTIVAATSLSAFYVSRRRTFLYATVGFAFYFFDVSLVFKDNFITPDAVFEAASFYDVGHPYTSIITGGGAFLFLWLAACCLCIAAPTISPSARRRCCGTRSWGRTTRTSQAR